MDFQAFVVDRKGDEVVSEVKRVRLDQLPEGDVLIRTAYSSVNYKDALACIPDGKIAKAYPHIPGIDAAGIVVESRTDKFQPGDAVVVTGYELGVSRHGGYSEYVRVPAEWVVPLPAGLTLKEAMTFGTAGLTAALSVWELVNHGVRPGGGPVLVTGASGGVGSLSAAILAKLGYEVTASTGKHEVHPDLLDMGVSEVISREAVWEGGGRPLLKQRWAAAVDCVGGRTLAAVLSQIRYGGAVAACGLTGGAELATTVYPFILRGVRLIGIDSVFVGMEHRKRMWDLLASEYKPAVLERISREISLHDIGHAVQELLQGRARGRTVVAL